MSATDPRPPLTLEEWRAEAVRRFGRLEMAWKFQCPVCLRINAVSDWKTAGAPETSVAFACVGRWTKEQDAQQGRRVCNYSGGGLFKLNPQPVLAGERPTYLFAFAEVEPAAVTP